MEKTTPLQDIQERIKWLDAFELGLWIKENINNLIQKEDQIDTSKVTRVEVINHQDGIGRVFTKYDCEDVSLSFQDENKTIKLFISKKEK